MQVTESRGERPSPEAQSLPQTGERLLTEEWDDNTLEHLHRYGVALEFCRDKHVLDIASGEGYGSNLLAAAARSVKGVDVAEEAVAHARGKYRRPNLEYLCGSADNIPLATASVDVVVSFETIEHHDRHAEMMAEVKRVLRPGGVLVISSPDKLHYSDLRNYSNPFHVKELYREEFRSLLEGYFGNVEVLLQRVVYGSLIAPAGGAGGFREYGGDFSGLSASAELGGALYDICVASDGALPPLPVSFYDGRRVYEAALRAAAEAAAAAHERRRELEVRAVLESRAFRLGRALTWPARKIMGR